MKNKEIIEHVVLTSPQGWESVPLINLVEKISTTGKKVQERMYLQSGKYPIIDQGQYLISGYSNDNTKVINVSKYVVVFGDHTKQVKIIDFDFVPGADGIKILKPKDVDAKFLYYLILYLSHLIPHKGYARHFQFIENAIVSVPIKCLQVEIANKIVVLFNQIDNVNLLLNNVSSKLESYKKSILNFAIRGKLVPQNPDDEPALILLEKIKAEKEKLIKAGKIKKEKPLSPINPDDIPFELPKGWEWCRLRDLTEIKGGLAKDSKKIYSNSKILPYLRVANVQRGFLDLSEIKNIDVPQDKIQSLLLRKGDILFNEGGDRDKLGRGWIWENQIDECIHQNHVFRARPYLNLINSEFISYYANSFGQNYFLSKGKQTTNLASVSLSVLSMLPIPLPPLNEQMKIIVKINDLMHKYSNLNKTLNVLSTKTKLLKQTILKNAFEGKLI